MYICCWNEYMTAPQWQEHLFNTMQTLRKNVTVETEGQSKASDQTVIIIFSYDNVSFKFQAAGWSVSSTLNEQVQFPWYLHSHVNRRVEGVDPVTRQCVSPNHTPATPNVSWNWFISTLPLTGRQFPLPLLLHHFVKLHSGSSVLNRRVALLPGLRTQKTSLTSLWRHF